MKKLILIFLISLSFMASKCIKDPDPDPGKVIVQFKTSEAFNTLIPRPFRKVSLVPGFEHQYDTCTLTISSMQDINEQFFVKSLIGPKWPDLALSEDGIYRFYAESNPDPEVISHLKSFIAVRPSADTLLASIQLIQLEEETKQALIIVDKASVDGVPTIQAGTNVGLMSTYVNFYYVYVTELSLIKLSVDNVPIERNVPFTRGEIYTWIPQTLSIETVDAFKTRRRL